MVMNGLGSTDEVAHTKVAIMDRKPNTLLAAEERQRV